MCEKNSCKKDESISFALFADMHYKEGMYASTVSDMTEILNHANENSVDFIIHAGDFCNDFMGSPEVVNTYLNNSFNMAVYGIYGNHELESKGNTMGFVTPLITNRANEVVWGTADGKIGDGTVGYYHFDKGDFRIICTDTNYSYNEQAAQWQHNTEASWGAPSGNIHVNSLGPTQLKWLEMVLLDAASCGKKCIVLSHATFNRAWEKTPDSTAVIELFERVNSIRRGTVIMAINGHHHTNRSAVCDGVLFFDVNSVRNGCWKGGGDVHYLPCHTFDKIRYDECGKEYEVQTIGLSELAQGKNTWFFKEPLSAIVKVCSNGKITVEGCESEWIYGVVPQNEPSFKAPKISSFEVNLFDE